MANDRRNILLLVRVVQEGDIPEIERILQLGTYINADEGGNINAKPLYRNLLMLAIDALQEDTAIVLINKGINLNHRYWGVEGKQSARDLAVENGLQLVVQLIDSMLPVSQQLFYAVCDGTFDRVKELVRHIDTNINMKVNLYGEKASGSGAYTLLLLAVRNGHEDVAVFLVENGIDTTFKHQEWDRIKPDSEPVLIESFDARTLAADKNMRTLERVFNKTQNKDADGKNNLREKESMVYTNHDRKENDFTPNGNNGTVSTGPKGSVNVEQSMVVPEHGLASIDQKTNGNVLSTKHAWNGSTKSHVCCVVV